MADITLNIVIPEAHTTRVLEAFTKAAGARIELNAHKHVNDTNFNGNWNFAYDPQGDTENSKHFAVRAILELIKALVKMVDYAEDQERYRTEVSAITPAAQDVPEDVVTGE